MHIKKISSIAIAACMLLLAVGCSATDNKSVQEADKNIEGNSVENTENIDKYTDNIPVKSFFELTEKLGNVNIEEVVQNIEKSNKNGDFVIENIDEGYVLKDSKGITELKILKGIYEAETMESLALVLHEENIEINTSVGSGGYTVFYEDTKPIILSSTISNYKEIDVDDLDDKYLLLQEKISKNTITNITPQEIEEIISCKLEEGFSTEEYSSFSVDGVNGSMTIGLENGNILSTIKYADIIDNGLIYDYTVATEKNRSIDETLTENRYRVIKVLDSKEALITFLKKIYK